MVEQRTHTHIHTHTEAIYSNFANEEEGGRRVNGESSGESLR